MVGRREGEGGPGSRTRARIEGRGEAKHGPGAERVEAMAKVKLGGSRARPRRAKVRPYTRSVTPSKKIARTVELDPAPWHVPDE